MKLTYKIKIPDAVQILRHFNFSHASVWIENLKQIQKTRQSWALSKPTRKPGFNCLCSKPPASKTSIKQCLRGTLDLAAHLQSFQQAVPPG